MKASPMLSGASSEDRMRVCVVVLVAAGDMTGELEALSPPAVEGRLSRLEPSSRSFVQIQVEAYMFTLQSLSALRLCQLYR